MQVDQGDPICAQLSRAKIYNMYQAVTQYYASDVWFAFTTAADKGQLTARVHWHDEQQDVLTGKPCLALSLRSSASKALRSLSSRLMRWST